jgi:hypothetical protein
MNANATGLASLGVDDDNNDDEYNDDCSCDCKFTVIPTSDLT